jgi:hypothetical protein
MLAWGGETWLRPHSQSVIANLLLLDITQCRSNTANTTPPVSSPVYPFSLPPNQGVRTLRPGWQPRVTKRATRKSSPNWKHLFPCLLWFSLSTHTQSSLFIYDAQYEVPHGQHTVGKRALLGLHLPLKKKTFQ